MLRKKPSSEIEVVCLTDPALDSVAVEDLRKYQYSRDIKDLGDLSRLPEKPTVFRCKPLAQRYEALVDDPSSDDLWLVFAHHVTTVRGFADDDGSPLDVPMDEVRGERVVGKEARELFGREVYCEVASVIIQRCNGKDGDTSPFSSPPAWERERGLRAIQCVLRGAVQPKVSAPMGETAKPTATASEANGTPDSPTT